MISAASPGNTCWTTFAFCVKSAEGVCLGPGRSERNLFQRCVLPYASANERRDDWRRGGSTRGFKPLISDCETAAEAAHKLNQKMFRVLNVKYSTARRRADQGPHESIEQGLASCTGPVDSLDRRVPRCGDSRPAGRDSNVDQPNAATTLGSRFGIKQWHFAGACEADPNGLNRGWFVGSAAKANADEWLHRIYATSFREGGTTFPFPWLIGRRGFRSAEQPQTSVNAVDVTARYTKKAGTTPGKANLMIQVFQKKGGARVSVAASLLAADGSDLMSGTTRDHRHDTNDMLEAGVRIGESYTVRLNWPDESGIMQTRRVPVTITRSEQLLELYLDE